jgi:hypothetical protein
VSKGGPKWSNMGLFFHEKQSIVFISHMFWQEKVSKGKVGTKIMRVEVKIERSCYEGKHDYLSFFVLHV